MFQKVTKSLFMGKYQHKIVLVTPIASAFRNFDTDTTLSHIKKMHIAFKLDDNKSFSYRSNKPKDESDFQYAYALHSTLRYMEDFDIRIESPWISIYTNNKKDLNTIVKLEPALVKYTSSPNTELEVGSIILPKVPYEYKVTIGKTTQNYNAFIEWASVTDKIKLTKSCRNMLSKERAWGGSYFYITGDKLLLMAKMHLGGAVGKIERIIKSAS